jgi:hypothetical protein
MSFLKWSGSSFQSFAPAYEYTSSYEDLLCKSKLPSLKVRRLRTFALEVFKIVNKDCPVYLFDLIDIKKILRILLDIKIKQLYHR